MTEEEAVQFFDRTRSIVTNLASTLDALANLAESFEARGGAAQMPVHGGDTEVVISLHNDLSAFMALNQRDRTLAKWRQDY